MVREEILTGLNNAVAHGESLQSAMQSLIMAGYNPQEVQESAGQVNMGVIGTIVQQNPQSPGYKPLPTAQAGSKKNPWILAGLLLVGFILLIGLGVYLYLGTNLFG